MDTISGFSCYHSQMTAFIDITGKRFSSLLAVLELDRRRRIWQFNCDCGQTIKADKGNVLSGHTRSCGCLVKKTCSRIGKTNLTHGHSSGITYICWQQMWARCTNSRHKGWKNYGGRGISVCKRWRKFENFLEDMGEKQPRASIDRINNNGNYEPGNCRWANAIQQANNCRTNRWLEINGQRMTVSQAAVMFGLPSSTVFSRLSRGESQERLFRKRYT